MRRCLVFFLLSLCVYTTYAQKTKSVTATYTYYAPEDISLEEAKHIAVNRAKEDAIANAFGTIITQNNTTVVSTTNGNSENRFFSLGGSEVKGEWIETTKEPSFNIKYEQGTLVVGVTLKGVVREFPKNNLTFSFAVLRNGTTAKYKSDDFKNGDDMYLQFSSPVDGYLIAYMYDETSDMVVCLLPYIAGNSNGNLTIKGGNNYLFFKRTSMDDSADEYTLTTNGKGVEFETLFLVFSTSPIYAITHNVARNNVGMRTVPYSSFVKWLAENRKRTDIKVAEKTRTIKP